jgi:hypothetical protein
MKMQNPKMSFMTHFFMSRLQSPASVANKCSISNFCYRLYGTQYAETEKNNIKALRILGS